MCQLAPQRRPGADNTHLLLQHIDELRQLIEAVSAKYLPDSGDARIVADF